MKKLNTYRFGFHEKTDENIYKIEKLNLYITHKYENKM